MLKQILLFSACLLMPAFFFAQLNLSFVSQYSYPGSRGDCSDIWGYVDQLGNEYAIVGNQNGTSIVSLADPFNPVEVFFSPGANTIWRDMKVWGTTAYITNEGGNGLKIIDLSNLPGAITAGDVYQYTGSTYPFTTAHNIYIDDVGRAYICGANNGQGGVIILDVDTDPFNPIELGRYNEFYVHDVYVRNDTLWGGAIEDGFLCVADVSDPSNIVTLATHFTPGNFTHQVWLSDDGQTLFTNDEISGGYVAAYDVSDIGNITESDKIQSSPGQDVIPHNTFVLGNFVITSFYRDGVVVHDATYPSNLIEVGNYDTAPSFGGDGFNGCWGVYPYLPSGYIIASDIEEGLYVLNPNYVQGAYLEGNVSDAITASPLNNVDVEIVATIGTDVTNTSGDYLTGLANGGTYDVSFNKVGYFPQTITGVVLTNGNTTTLDVQLQPMITYTLNGTVVDANSNPISNAQVYIHNDQIEHQTTTNGLGEFSVSGFLEGVYDVTIGQWGYHTLCLEDQNLTMSGNPYEYQLETGYSDFFDVDLGWTVSGNPTSGDWERGVPVGTTYDSQDCNPGNDSQDCGEMAYVTGNGGGQAGDDDVDAGATILTSPVFDLSGYNNPYLSYERWFFNDGGSGSPNDSLRVQITNGTQTVNLDISIAVDPLSGQWAAKEFKLLDHITLTPFMQLKVRTTDVSPGHLSEGGFDNFMIVDSSELGIDNVVVNKIVRVLPNPFNDKLTIELDDYQDTDNLALELIEVGSGKVVYSSALNSSTSEHTPNCQAGVYLIRVRTSDSILYQEKLVKL